MLIAKLNPAFTVVGEAESIRDGAKLIETLAPDVVFLDIKMPDGSGFDLLKRIEVINFAVVFVTGFDQYTLKALEFNALDYVLKPIDIDKFKATLEKVQLRLTEPDYTEFKEIIQSYASEESIITKIPVQYPDRVEFLSVDKIMYIRSNGKFTKFFKYPAEEYQASRPLDEFEFIVSRLPDFIRVDSETYVNARFVVNYSKQSNALVMKNLVTIGISSKMKSEVLNLIKNASKY